jgi:hypothetical protein
MSAPFFYFAEIFPFFYGQIIGLKGIACHFQMAKPKHLAGVFTDRDRARFFSFALRAGPIKQRFSDLLKALRPLLIITEVPA